jgi:hypothetical protein
MAVAEINTLMPLRFPSLWFGGVRWSLLVQPSHYKARCCGLVMSRQIIVLLLLKRGIQEFLAEFCGCPLLLASKTAVFSPKLLLGVTCFQPMMLFMLPKTFGSVESSDIFAPAAPIILVSQDKSFQCSKL